MGQGGHDVEVQREARALAVTYRATLRLPHVALRRSNKYLQDMARSGMFMDLTDFVVKDPRIQWPDIMSYFRDTAAVGGRIMAIPLEGISFALFYRRDVLAAANVTTPPHTWDGERAACLGHPRRGALRRTRDASASCRVHELPCPT